MLPLGKLTLLIESLTAEAEYRCPEVGERTRPISVRTALGSASSGAGYVVPSWRERLAGNAGLRIGKDNEPASR